MANAAKANSLCVAHGNSPTTFSTDVKVGGLGALRQGDLYGAHGTVIIGSTKVYINGQGFARQGDAISGPCSSVIGTGSSKVNVG